MLVGLLPHRRRKNQELLAELTRDASTKHRPGHAVPGTAASASVHDSAALEARQHSNSLAGTSGAGQDYSSSPSRGMQKPGGTPDALPASGNCRCAAHCDAQLRLFYYREAPALPHFSVRDINLSAESSILTGNIGALYR